MYNALKSGETDVISAYSSDGRIVADGLVILEDPLGALPSYDAMIMLNPERAGDVRLKTALAPLIGAIDVSLMREANYMVDRSEDKRSPAEVARWLDEQIRR
jgi:osmoprotectant transport system permease protein